MKIYNTLTRNKEDFIPIKEGRISFYHCGPTVYWTQHIGNMRAVVMTDLVYRSLEYLGYDVTLVRNYTDVGHLSGDNNGDADSGEDRMEKAAKREGKTPEAIARYYTEKYEQDRELLNTYKPKYCPRATEHIPEMIELVQLLLEKGFAYATDLAIYFDVSKKEDYTKLSGQKLDEQQKDSGSGSVSDPKKKNPADFALWFFKAGAHEYALQTWPSPFRSPLVKNGQGFPGWHIECSAMIKKYLGITIDIHMGGIEHVPIHHTNEIAQSESAHGTDFVHYWIHNEHLLANGAKMSKSEGTSYSLADIQKKGFSALDLRYFFLQAHYRSKQNFTWEALKASRKAFLKIQNFLKKYADEQNGTVDESFQKEFIKKIEDDFNIPAALGVLHSMMKSDIPSASKVASLLDFDKVLGLNLVEVLANPQPEASEVPKKIQKLLDERALARTKKNWEASDALRKEIQNLGYEVIDEDGEQKIKKS